MSMMKYKAEQIVTVLRQIEVGIANGRASKSKPTAKTETGIPRST